MKIVDQSANLLIQQPGLQGIYKQIELASRTCYKSEDKITNDSAEKMVNALINSKHYAMLEHGTVYLYLIYTSPLTDDYYLEKTDLVNRYSRNSYSVVRTLCEDNYITDVWITTNYRVIIENNWQDDLQYLVEPLSNHAERHSIRVVTNLQVSHELVRHREMSFAMESSRYCNYSASKFGNELTFIRPNWLDESLQEDDFTDVNTDVWYKAMLEVEKSYFYLLKYGWKPQQAAQVLPKALKTELVITGFDFQWKHFFDLRLYESTGSVHPQMKELSKLMFLALSESIYGNNI